MVFTGVLGQLSREKHIERQVRGRRLSSPCSVVYRSTGNPDQPVQLTENWQIPGFCELLRKSNVQQLEVSSGL